jgi:hypothetical protein
MSFMYIHCVYVDTRLLSIVYVHILMPLDNLIEIRKG